MAYVITDTCTKDELCVQACPVDCIHPKQDEAGFAETPQLYVKPDDCIDCGACIPVCPTNSIFVLEELPEEYARFADINAAHYNWSNPSESPFRALQKRHWAADERDERGSHKNA